MALWRIESSGALTLANSFTYGTWGEPTTATHNSIGDLEFRFLYVGMWDVQWDADLGLHYMHARHYSPDLGRFVQPDPSRLDAQLFVYAENGPVSKVDPTGHICFFPFGMVICVEGAKAVAAAAVSAAAWVGGQVGAHFYRHPIRFEASTPKKLTWGNCYQTYHRMGCWYLSKQDKRLSPGEVKALERKLKGEGGVHGLKGQYGRGKDLFKKPNGDIVVKPRNGWGPGEPTGWNVRDLRTGGR
jgi:RHS repeat-associated protein